MNMKKLKRSPNAGGASAAQLGLLRRAIAVKGELLKPDLLKATQEGMLKRVDKVRRKGITVTFEYLMEEIKNDKGFLETVKGAGLEIEDFENVANGILKELDV